MGRTRYPLSGELGLLMSWELTRWRQWHVTGTTVPASEHGSEKGKTAGGRPQGKDSQVRYGVGYFRISRLAAASDGNELGPSQS